jgi:uncharacterized protein YqhQ
MSNQPLVTGPDGVARPYIGGQALIEGVMMRSPHAVAAVVRRANGELVVREEPMPDLRTGKLAWPLVRGVAALVEALKLGSRSLRFSLEVFESDMDQADAEGRAAPKSKPGLLSLLSLPILALTTGEPELPRKSGKEGRGLLTLVSILFAIGLFVALPQAAAAGVGSLLGLDLDVRSPIFQALTGAAKITVIISYMLLIRRMPEIYRVFQYHGAEHKAIYTYEAGEELSVENARPKTTLHPRCGTTFLVMVAMVSVLVFSALGPLLPELGLGKLADNVLFFFLKLPFLPVIAAITFELQRLLARYGKRGPLRLLLWPGFLVQKITTIEPDDRQLEVAMAALAVTLGRERAPGTAAAADRSYPSYGELLTRAA